MLLLVLGPQQSHNRRLIMFFRHSFSRSTLQQRSQVSKFAIIICSVPSLYYYSITTDSCCKCDTGDYMKRQEDIPLLLKCNTNVSTTSDKSILHHHQTSILASSPTAVSIKPIKHKRWRFKWWQKNTKQQYDTSINKKQSYWWNRIGKTFFVLTRGIEITVRLCPLIVMTPTAMLVSRCFRESTWVSDISWRYTLHTLQCLGPAFVKLGQWAATRRDLFPLHMCIRLSELQDTARVHDWKYTHQSLCEAFGQDYESSGLVVSRESILGSGSVGQVHRGTLQSNEKNIDVAVKVLHPNTKQLVQRDLALMAYIAEFIDKMIPLTIVKMLSLPRAVTNFSNVIERQVDLRVEGDNLQVFRHNFDCSDSNKRPQSITFPKPEPDWISEKVLVEEYAGDDAVPIAHYLSDNSQEGLKIRKKLAGPLLRGFLQMVFTDNFVHADLHPGNILVKATPSKKGNPKECNYTIIFLDAGIATSLQPNDKANLRDLFKAVVLNDGYTAGELMVERARYQRCTEIPNGKHDFACGVAKLVSEFHDRRKQGLTLGAVNVGSLLGQVLDLCRQFSVEIDPAMSSVVVSMLVLEGVGRSLDPDLNLIKAAIPFLIGR